MMKRRLMTAVFCALALLTNGAGALLAQTQQRVRQGAPPPPPPVHDMTFERVPGPPGHDEFFEMRIAPGTPGDSFNFTFMSSEMHFDSKIVRGAPYSAESVTESVQMLADGNRITRTSKASVYRDSEGRTRRDQTLNHIGSWTTSDEPSQTVFINDPVAGTHYILNPRARTAQKMSNVFHFKRTMQDGEHAPVGDGPRTQVFTRSEGGSSTVVVSSGNAAKPINAGAAGLSGKAIKKVQPTYPAIAKAAGAEGPVSVQIVIGESGEVESAKAIAGHPLLQQAAVTAAREWRFSPTKLSGNAVKVAGTISFVFALPKEGEPPAGAMMVRTPAPGGLGPHEGEHRPKPVTESLGKQSIEGVEAEGTRTTVTFQAGAIGNERPINIVSERWYSPELQTVVMTKHSDPRFGETSYRLTNINRSEPARTLFEVPSDYTLKAEQTPMRRMRLEPSKMRQPQEQQQQQQQ